MTSIRLFAILALILVCPAALHAEQLTGTLAKIKRDGYITLRGLWCEPLSHERVNTLNHRLAAAHRAVRLRQEVS